MTYDKNEFKIRFKKLAIRLGIVFIALIAYYFIRLYTSFSIPCLYHILTGLNCPGCGMTRMFSAMLQFNFAEAMTYNYFFFFSLPILFTIIITAIIYYLFNIKWQKWFVIVAMIYLALSIAWAIIRNIYGI